MRRAFGLFLISLVLVPSPAAAHSNAVETSPENGATLETLPAEATVTLSEAPQTAAVVLERPGGQVDKLKAQIDGSTIKVELPADGPRGAYTLSYRVVSADGHPVSGSTTFTVTQGAAAATPTPTPTPEAAEPARGALIPIVIGVAVLGAAATVLVARSMRR